VSGRRRRNRGKADPDNDDFLLLHGHYDSWYVGITDNATGDAGMLEAARVFDEHSDELERNLRVAWWPGHSTGRYAGSTWYADEFAQELATNCVAQVNMDSPGAKDATEYTDMSCWCPEAHGLVGETIDDVTGAPYAEQFPFPRRRLLLRQPRHHRLLHALLEHPGRGTRAPGLPRRGWLWRQLRRVARLDGHARESRRGGTPPGYPRVRHRRRTRAQRGRAAVRSRARSAAKLQEAVDAYAGVAGDQFDFSPTLDRLETLETELEAFQSAAEAGEIDPETANETIKSLSRVLTRLYLVQRGQFEQDPRRTASRSPLLGGPEVRNRRRHRGGLRTDATKTRAEHRRRRTRAGA